MGIDNIISYLSNHRTQQSLVSLNHVFTHFIRSISSNNHNSGSTPIATTINSTSTSSTTATTTTAINTSTSCAILHMYGSKYKNLLDNTSIRYLLNLDENIAILLVLIEERCLRGSAYSSVWAQPANFVWSQSISITEKNLSRSQWWPCMIIACGGKDSSSSNSSGATTITTTNATTTVGNGNNSTTTASASTTGSNSISSKYPSVKYHLHDEVMAVNMRRIPSDIVKQLMKLRPRTGMTMMMMMMMMMITMVMMMMLMQILVILVFTQL